jgi:hypothetical protein
MGTSLTHNGVTMNVRGWEKHLGLSAGSIWHRIKNGWPLERALSVPRIEPYRYAFRIDAEAGAIYGQDGRRVGYLNTTGYIRIARHQNNTLSAHRLIWESVHGPIPDGMQINHINGDKADNRIANLEIVTPQQNSRHAVRTGLIKPKFGEENRASKLTSDNVRRIRQRLIEGASQRAIAAEFRVSQGAIWKIASGKAWGRTT